MKTKTDVATKERRSLIEGLNPAGVDRSLEKEFVYSGKPKPPEAPPAAPAPAAETREGKGQSRSAINRMPLTTRVRADFAAALKRASLERQLNGVTPHTLQDILEEALEPWLRNNGYLK